jgi:hypothetical protein
MRRLLGSWNTVFSKLGLAQSRNRKTPKSYSRRVLRMEALEHRRVLATATVSTVADVVDAPNVTSTKTR